MQNVKLGATGFYAAALAIAITLGGCAKPQPPSAQQLMVDDTYTTRVVLADKSTMQWDGLVNIETTPDGTVHIYGTPSNNRKPNVKVSGKGKFVVHSIANLKVDDGATVEAHDCDLIKAGERTSVKAFQCRTVRALTTTASVEPHGNTTVEWVEAQIIQPEAREPRVEAK